MDLWGFLPHFSTQPRAHRRETAVKAPLFSAAERLGSSQFDYAQEEQKDPRDNGRDEQRAATAEPVGEEDEHDNRME